jgi:hypothetical protein
MLKVGREEANPTWSGIGIARHVAPDPLSTNAMTLAVEWLTECLHSHPDYQASQEAQLPTRVVDVGCRGENPRLYITNGEKGTYVTLSHCWGSFVPLRNTNSTLASHLSRIEIAKMPKTFQDAVRVTHLLGFKYIWIDSLCIIQDSKKDWDIESSRMQDGYSHAALNISADAALDSTAGLGSRERLVDGVAVGNLESTERVFVRPVLTLIHLRSPMYLLR